MPFVDQSEYLSSLLDDPRVDGIFQGLMGKDYNYIGSDGNFYVGDTNWHSDTDWSGVMRGKPPRVYYKMAIYLDHVTRESGALRVIPGSHRWGDMFAESVERSVRKAPEVLGISGAEVPAIALESLPGDVVVFNQNLKHSSWGGGKRRRMFTLNTTARFADADLPYLRNEVTGFARFWVDSVYGPAMVKGPGSRMVHLKQALDNQGHLAEEVRKAKATMKEPSRGLSRPPQPLGTAARISVPRAREAA